MANFHLSSEHPVRKKQKVVGHSLINPHHNKRKETTAAAVEPACQEPRAKLLKRGNGDAGDENQDARIEAILQRQASQWEEKW